MAKRIKPRKSERCRDLAAVRWMLDEITSVPSGLRAQGRTTNDRRSDLIERYQEHRERLAGLRGEFIPEALVAPTCMGHMNSSLQQTPWDNFISCFDFCEACRGEALRALRVLEAHLVGAEKPGQFLPPEVIAARNAEATRWQSERDRARSDQARRGGLGLRARAMKVLGAQPFSTDGSSQEHMGGASHSSPTATSPPRASGATAPSLPW